MKIFKWQITYDDIEPYLFLAAILAICLPVIE